MATKRFLVEVFGWYGAAAIVTAYGLVSFEVVEPTGWVYQGLNLTGSIGILVISLVKRAYQPAALNVVWLLVAAVAISNIVR